MVQKVKNILKSIGILSNNSLLNRNLVSDFRISDNAFLPGQPSYDIPNDAYETVHLPKHDILE